ncbi:MAG TPA: outer membrane protein assembly factor BamA [Anaeromyxobacter sp.]|nr:outer membrane protein assembly factor BamA [Anaeromyxobacter sp.]
MAVLRQTLVALLLALLPGAAAVRAAGVTVKEVRVEGTRRTDPAAIQNVLGTKAGQPLDLNQVDADIRAIIKLGAYQDALAEEEGSPEAPVVVFRVVERPTVRQVTTVGNEELKKDDLKDTVSLKTGAVYDPAQAGKDIEKIQKKYTEKGYFLTDVTVRTSPQADNQVDVVYTINEHAKVQVKEIRFVGNDHVPKEDITPYLQTKEGGLLSFLSPGTFREDAFDADLQSVQAVYLEHGYVEAKVGKASVQLSPDRQLLFITIPVVEGLQYDLGEITFGGVLLGQEARLKKVLTVKTGQRFVRSKVGNDLTAIQDVYKDQGYAYVNVEPRTAPHQDTRRVDIDFYIQPGEKVRIGRIEIVGNDRTRDKVIRRELRLYEGELFSGTGYRDSKNRVTALGYFETVDLAQTKKSPEVMDITVTVKERATGSFQLGAGFSSYENFVLTGQISQQDFLGWGNSLTLQVQWSSIRQLGEISFAEPYFLDTRWTFSFDLYASEVSYSNFTRRAVGGSLTWGYELAGLQRWWQGARSLEDVRLFATLVHENVDVTTSSSVEVARATGTGSTSSLRLALTADKRDNRLTPTSGWYGSFGFETAPRFPGQKWAFGSDVNLFNRYTLDLRGYYPFPLGIVGRVRLNMGWLQSLSSRGVPLSELFYVGGINTIRGYRFQSIAPLENEACTNSPYTDICRVNGEGYQEVILNLEAEFPLLEKSGIRGVVFFDAGNSYAAGKLFHDPTVSWSLYKSVGLGLRWFSPLGPLRFEWGFPLNRRKDSLGNSIDEPLDFQFTIGNFF